MDKFQIYGQYFCEEWTMMVETHSGWYLGQFWVMKIEGCWSI